MERDLLLGKRRHGAWAKAFAAGLMMAGLCVALVASGRDGSAGFALVERASAAQVGAGEAVSAAAVSRAPHVVMAVLDDAGWDDLLGSSDLAPLLPHLEALAREGVSLSQHYSAHECTPSRAMLLTGRHAISLGFQRGTVASTSAWGLAPSVALLPSLLKELEPRYHAVGVGKWHLGHYAAATLPTSRGFEEWAGFFSGFVDPVSLVSEAPPACARDAGPGLCARDWHSLSSSSTASDSAADSAADGSAYALYACRDSVRHFVRAHASARPDAPLLLYYALPTPHEPLQAPPDAEAAYGVALDASIGPRDASSSNGGRRRAFAAMMAASDGAVGDCVAALRKADMWSTTIFVVLSDNGAAASGGSNWPLRGAKGGYFEGAVRTRALLAGPLLPPARRGASYDGLVHVADWTPTLLRAVREQLDLSSESQPESASWETDGVDQWAALRGVAPPVRNEILLNADTSQLGGGTAGALRRGKWKLLENVRHEPVYDRFAEEDAQLFDWLSSEPVSLLFDVIADPTESTDLSQAEPLVLAELRKRLSDLHQTAAEPAFCAPTAAALAQARAAFAQDGDRLNPWRELAQPGDRSHCDDDHADTPLILADDCARGLLSPSVCARENGAR